MIKLTVLVSNCRLNRKGYVPLASTRLLKPTSYNSKHYFKIVIIWNSKVAMNTFRLKQVTKVNKLTVTIRFADASVACLIFHR